MRLSACLLVALLLPWPVAAAAGGDAHRIDVELRYDRSERVLWRVQSSVGVSELVLPSGALVRAVSGAAYRLEDERIVFAPPTRDALLTLDLPPPDESLHPLYSRRFPLPHGDLVELALRAPEGFAFFHASHGQLLREGIALAYAGRGEVDLVYAYRSPYDADAGLVEFDEGIYHVVAPARSEPAARRIASLASNASIAAAEHADLPLPRPVWVRFAPDRAFGGEAGYYGYDGIVAIRRDELATGALDGHPWRGAETLAHETFHAVTFPHGEARLAANVTWWLEGSARFSERFVSGVDGWRACDAGWCVSFQSQLNATQLRSAYDGTFGFLPNWTLHNEARYRHAAYLVAAYVDRYGVDAYRAAWEDVREGARSPACPCDEAWLLQILVLHSGGRATRDEIYRPFGDLREDDRAAFDARTARLVAQTPAAGAPVPWRPLGAPNVTAPAPVPRRLQLDPPLVGTPDALLRGRVEGVSLIEDASPPGAPNARLVVRVDGEAAAALVQAASGDLTLLLANLSSGEHVVEAEAVSLHGAPFDPPLRAEARFVVQPRYAIAIDDLPAGVHAPPFLLSSTIRDEATGAALANVTVALYVDGARTQATLTQPDGRAYFEVSSLPRLDALLGVVVEDGAGVPLAEATWRLPAQLEPSAPSSAPGETPAAALESEEEARSVPMAPLALALLVALAFRRRR